MVAMAVSVGAPTAGAAPVYKVTDLDPLSVSDYSVVFGLNNAGQVVGYSYPPDPGAAFRATRWDGVGQRLDLGTLGGDFSTALAINEAGHIVGGANVIDSDEPNAYSHAFVWTAEDRMTDLGMLGDPSRAPDSAKSSSAAVAINESGDAAGVSATGLTFINSHGVQDVQRHPFIWTAGTGMTDIGTLGGQIASANDVNDTGVVVGVSTTSLDLHQRAFVWTAGDGMTDLGTLGGDRSIANSVNNAGQVVGESTTSDGIAARLPLGLGERHGRPRRGRGR